MFIYIIGYNALNRKVQDYFQYSRSTVIDFIYQIYISISTF